MNANRTHLQAASFAALITGAVVAVLLAICQRAEHRYIYAFAPELSDVKLQGVALQQAAFQQPDLLVLYGSSELVKEVPNRATDFFSQFPTGFRVFPVGKAGTISLANLLKLAAVGDEEIQLDLLETYGIHPASLFPGLDGLARYIRQLKDLT